MYDREAFLSITCQLRVSGRSASARASFYGPLLSLYLSFDTINLNLGLNPVILAEESSHFVKCYDRDDSTLPIVGMRLIGL